MKENQENICQECGHEKEKHETYDRSCREYVETHSEDDKASYGGIKHCPCASFRAQNMTDKGALNSMAKMIGHMSKESPAPSQPSLKVSECCGSDTEWRGPEMGTQTLYCKGCGKPAEFEHTPDGYERIAPKKEKESAPSLKSPEDKIAGNFKQKLEHYTKEVVLAAKYWGNKETSDNGTAQIIDEAKRIVGNKVEDLETFVTQTLTTLLNEE